MIELKNIDLSKVTDDEQLRKLFGEFDELVTIITDNDLEDNSFEHFTEETFDLFQVCIGIAEKKYKKSAEYVMSQYPKHLSKIKDRPRVKEDIK